MDLVIMAAGMGSRFGGLKQLTPIDNNGNFIIDYSIYDAIKCGFNKVVFIIKQEHYDIFRETVGKRVEKQINVEYVFQNNDNVPANVVLPSDRTKPLGTAHAILCAANKIGSDFAVINADDFYGRDAFRVVADFLKHNKSSNVYSVVGYKATNTIGDSGSVKRGLCKTENGKLVGITECSLFKEGGKLYATPLSEPDAPKKPISPDTFTSMNLFGFPKQFLENLYPRFVEFLDKNKADLTKCEYLLPEVVDSLIKEGKASVDVLPTSAVWYGMTYKEDKDGVIASIKALVDKGEYPKNLWN